MRLSLLFSLTVVLMIFAAVGLAASEPTESALTKREAAMQAEINRFETQLKNVRQKVAHLDISKAQDPMESSTGLTIAEVDGLAQAIPEIFNKLSRAHDGQSWAFDHQPERSGWETEELRRIMREEKERSQQVIDELEYD